MSRYIEPNPSRPGVDDARLADFGVPVWALVGHYHAIRKDAAQVAQDYELPQDAVEAALAYYRRHKAIIDARIAANLAYPRWPTCTWTTMSRRASFRSFRARVWTCRLPIPVASG